MKAISQQHLSVKDYLALEKDSQEKYEFHNGQVIAMAGGTYAHGLLCGNIYSELRNRLRESGSTCKPLSSEIKLHIPTKNSYVHPDAMVICDEVEKAAMDANAVTNPSLIVEVLSNTTADYDRGDKFHLYRQLSSLKEYILIDQYKVQVDIYYKPPGVDLWQILRYEGLNSSLPIKSLGIEIAMQDLYFDIEGLNN